MINSREEKMDWELDLDVINNRYLECFGDHTHNVKLILNNHPAWKKAIVINNDRIYWLKTPWDNDGHREFNFFEDQFLAIKWFEQEYNFSPNFLLVRGEIIKLAGKTQLEMKMLDKNAIKTIEFSKKDLDPGVVAWANVVFNDGTVLDYLPVVKSGNEKRYAVDFSDYSNLILDESVEETIIDRFRFARKGTSISFKFEVK